MRPPARASRSRASPHAGGFSSSSRFSALYRDEFGWVPSEDLYGRALVPV